MAKYEDIQHAVLVVSDSPVFDDLLKKQLPPGKYMAVDFKRSGASARRAILERYYDIAIINAPLSDEQGVGLALDIAEQCSASILVTVPSDRYGDVLSRVTDAGILALAKPFPKVMMGYALRFLMAEQKKIRRLEKKISAAQEKAEELRIVSKAKVLLVEQKHMSEDEAHKLIGKMAMDQGRSRKRIAEDLIDQLS